MTEAHTLAELKPCPSGHSGNIATNYDDEFEAYSVDCNHPGCTWRTWGNSEAEAIEAWNTRRPSPPDGEIAELALVPRQITEAQADMIGMPRQYFERAVERLSAKEDG